MFGIYWRGVLLLFSICGVVISSIFVDPLWLVVFVLGIAVSFWPS